MEEIHSTVIDRAPKKDVEWMCYRLKQMFPRMCGEENARTSNELMHWMELPSKGTNQLLRSAMKKLLVEEGVPVISCSAGFFIAEKREELDKYKASLKSRCDGLYRDIKAVNKQLECWSATQTELGF